MSPEIFAARFKEAREKKNITIKALQPLVGASPSAMNGYSTGKNLPPLDIACKIATELDVSLDWLCGIETTTRNVGIHTNSDVLRFLAELVITKTVYSEQGVIYGAYIDTEYDSIVISSNRLPVLIDMNTWKNLSDLVRKGIVGEDVYHAWIDKEAKSFDCFPFPLKRNYLQVNQCDEPNADALPF